jgi:hypothetical protein
MRSFRQLFSGWSHLTFATRIRANDGGQLGTTASPAWRTVYVAALLEKDQDLVAQRIAEAKTALVIRARELFLKNEDHFQEESAIDEAFQALHALEQCTTHLCVHAGEFSHPAVPDDR